MEILFKDKYIVVCQKAAGELSEGEGDGCLPTLISQALRAESEDSSIFPVHRLDRETVGVMVYARTKKAAAELSESVREGRLEKIYLAVCHGAPEQSAGELCDLLFYDRKRGKSYIADRKRAGVKNARLAYEVLATKNEMSLLRIKLYTGRTHQIRVQLASRKMPLVGDRRYGAPKSEARGIALVAQSLSFPHPHSGEPMTFHTECPTDFPWSEFEE